VKEFRKEELQTHAAKKKNRKPQPDLIKKRRHQGRKVKAGRPALKMESEKMASYSGLIGEMQLKLCGLFRKKGGRKRRGGVVQKKGEGFWESVGLLGRRT